MAQNLKFGPNMGLNVLTPLNTIFIVLLNNSRQRPVRYLYTHDKMLLREFKVQWHIVSDEKWYAQTTAKPSMIPLWIIVRVFEGNHF